MLASIESFFGTVWFCALTLIAGYVAGHVVPFKTLLGLVFKKKD